MCPIGMNDPENIGIAVGISLVSSVETEIIYIYSTLFRQKAANIKINIMAN